MDFRAYFTLTSVGYLLASAAPLSAQATFTLPATWRYPSSAAVVAEPGFQGRIQQARKTSGLSATIARGNGQLAGLLIDPTLMAAYVNQAVKTGDAIIANGWQGTTPVSPTGGFTIPDTINFFTDANGLIGESGAFNAASGQTDRYFPGLPGDSDGGLVTYENGQNFSIEFLAWLDLPVGDTVIGVHHDDAMQLAFHSNDARDIFRQQAVGFDSNSGTTNRTVTVTVTEAGLYPMRLLMAQWTGSAMLELFNNSTADGTTPVLVNDSAVGALKAYRSLNVPSRPYVADVSPEPDASGVEASAEIVVQMENLAPTAMPTLKVNNNTVTYTRNTVGTQTTLRFTPTVQGGQRVTAELSYGEATSTWSYSTRTGKSALMVTGGGSVNSGDGAVRAALSALGFDVTVKSDAAVTVDDAAGTGIIFVSATVNSGLVAGDEFENLEIPLVLSESFNCDDFKLVDAPYDGKFANNAAGGLRNLAVQEVVHPITSGLTVGDLEIFTTNIQTHWGQAPPSAVNLVAAPSANNSIVFAIEKGGEVMANDGSTFAHPARRVFLGLGNDGAGALTDNGKTLLRQALSWAIAPPVLPDATPVLTSFMRDAADRSVTLAWKSVRGRSYRVERTDDPAKLVWDFLTTISAEGNESTFSDRNATTLNRSFYRIRLLPP